MILITVILVILVPMHLNPDTKALWVADRITSLLTMQRSRDRSSPEAFLILSILADLQRYSPSIQLRHLPLSQVKVSSLVSLAQTAPVVKYYGYRACTLFGLLCATLCVTVDIVSASFREILIGVSSRLLVVPMSLKSSLQGTEVEQLPW